MRDYVTDSEELHFDENQVASIMLPIIDAVRRLHKRNVVHRDLRMETISIKVRKSGRTKVQLSCLDMAFCLKAGQQVTQTFNVERVLAPEIETGLPHDSSTDIWSLGQIAYQLLCDFKEMTVSETDFLAHN